MPSTNDPATPRDVLAMRKGNSLKPDAQGRLIFRPRGVAGPGYVVENVDQLRRAERFHAIKLTVGVITVGAAIGAMLTMQASDDLARATGSVAVLLRVDPAKLRRGLGGRASLINRAVPCPVVGCNGRAYYLAAAGPGCPYHVLADDVTLLEGVTDPVGTPFRSRWRDVTLVAGPALPGGLR